MQMIRERKMKHTFGLLAALSTNQSSLQYLNLDSFEYLLSPLQQNRRDIILRTVWHVCMYAKAQNIIISSICFAAKVITEYPELSRFGYCNELWVVDEAGKSPKVCNSRAFIFLSLIICILTYFLICRAILNKFWYVVNWPLFSCKKSLLWWTYILILGCRYCLWDTMKAGL